MSDFDPATIVSVPKHKLSIFIVSTYGEGEPSDNLGEFWSWIGNTSDRPLHQLTYAAFGLGNSNYKYFNAVVDHVASRLQSLGARELLNTGKADDSQGETEEHYLKWKTGLFESLRANLGYEEHDPVYEPAIEVDEKVGGPSDDTYSGKPWIIQSRTNCLVSPTHALPVKSAIELFKQTQDRNCIHMEIDLSEQPGLTYKTGDHLGIWASNPTREVAKLLKCLGREVSHDTDLHIHEIDQSSKAKVPEHTTINALLTHYLEICAPLSREEIGSLVQFAPTSSAEELLTRLSKDKSAYESLVESTYVNFGRLLELAAPEDGAWRQLPLSFIIETLPAMRPRYYSISSSSVVQPRRVAITAVVADKILSAEQCVPGLCPNFLRNRKAASESTGNSEAVSTSIRIIAHVRKSTFKLPALSSHPIVMVAAGTGIAPFRAFIQERARLLRMGRPVGHMLLIFGCRNEEEDYLYCDELRETQEILGSKFALLTAFSRPHSGNKMYVQDRIAENEKDFVKLLVDSEANFYICGSAAMARDVSRVVSSALGNVQAWRDEEVRDFMEKQKRTRRWHQDVWG